MIARTAPLAAVERRKSGGETAIKRARSRSSSIRTCRRRMRHGTRLAAAAAHRLRLFCFNASLDRGACACAAASLITGVSVTRQLETRSADWTVNPLIVSINRVHARACQGKCKERAPFAQDTMRLGRVAHHPSTTTHIPAQLHKRRQACDESMHVAQATHSHAHS